LPALISLQFLLILSWHSSLHLPSTLLSQLKYVLFLSSTRATDPTHFNLSLVTLKIFDEEPRL
jgi:hypothetical protein